MDTLVQSSKNDQVLSFRQCSEEEEKWNDSEPDHSAWPRTFIIYRSAQIWRVCHAGSSCARQETPKTKS